MTIHDRNITVSEFERIYKKNNSNPAIEQQTVEEYLELFINFKLKVIEAEEMGLDTTEAFIREFNGYKKQLAKPYLSDKEEIEVLVKEAFERSQYDIHASHILLRCDQFASAEDTLKVYEKIMEIRNKLLAGEDFGTVARAVSDDPSVKTNSGDLGYFTVFRMVYPFESGAYNTKVGEISMPVRTRFGYHLIRINDRRPARGQIKVAHIMVLTPETMSESDKAKAKEKIDLYYDSLQLGADFAEIAEKYSEDRGSAIRGGELQWFGTGRMVAEFEKASFELEEVGEISEPIKTAFGWHIIKLLDKKTVEDFESNKAELENLVSKSDRSSFSKKAKIEKLKKQYNFEEYPGNLSDFYLVVDTTIFQRTWEASKADHLNDILFKIGDRKFNQSDFAKYLQQGQGGRQMDIQVYVNSKYRTFVETSVMQYEEDQLADKYPEFRYLLQEYHDGILLFDLTDQMVWTKAVLDSAGLEAFYNDSELNYNLESRQRESILNILYDWLKNHPLFKKFFSEKNRIYRQILFFGILFLIVLFAFFRLYKMNVHKLFYQSADNYSAPFSMIEREDAPSNFDKRISEEMGKKNYRQAVRYLYLKALTMLARKQLIDIESWKGERPWHPTSIPLRKGWPRARCRC